MAFQPGEETHVWLRELSLPVLQIRVLDTEFQVFSFSQNSLFKEKRAMNTTR